MITYPGRGRGSRLGATREFGTYDTHLAPQDPRKQTARSSTDEATSPLGGGALVNSRIVEPAPCRSTTLSPLASCPRRRTWWILCCLRHNGRRQRSFIMVNMERVAWQIVPEQVGQERKHSLADRAPFRHAGWAIQRIRQFYMRKVKHTQTTWHDKLTAILEDFPKVRWRLVFSVVVSKRMSETNG